MIIVKITNGSPVFFILDGRTADVGASKRRNDMKTMVTRLVSGAFILAILISPVWAVDLVLYDDFNAKLINPDKWLGRVSGNELRETVREIKGNRLHLLGRGYGRTDISSGESTSGVQVFFPNPDLVAIKATLQVKNYELVGCGASDTGSRVRARIVGSFFNTTDAPTSGSPENDVWAQIRLQRNANSSDSPKVLLVRAGVFRCTDSTCTGTEALGAEQNLGTASVGEKVTLRLEWDQSNHQFIAQRDNEPEVFLPYLVSDTSTPGAKFRRMEVNQGLANCTAQPRPVGFMDAYFDDVFVNQ